MYTIDVERKRATVMNADVVGYSRMMAHGDLQTVAHLIDCMECICALVRGYGGRVLDTIGDNLSAEFDDEPAAVRCGQQIQRTLADRNRCLPEDERMAFRIGIHSGEVLAAKTKQGTRVYGDVVNIAARLQNRAEAGHMVVSASVADRLGPGMSRRLTDLGPQRFKNIPYTVAAVEVRIAGDAA
ncbi:MAG: adenylate/guanylate cyclase domain-containing protein [Polyangiales bacterium]